MDVMTAFPFISKGFSGGGVFWCFFFTQNIIPAATPVIAATLHRDQRYRVKRREENNSKLTSIERRVIKGMVV